MKKRIISILLTTLLVVSLLPVTALADVHDNNSEYFSNGFFDWKDLKVSTDDAGKLTGVSAAAWYNYDNGGAIGGRAIGFYVVKTTEDKVAQASNKTNLPVDVFDNLMSDVGKRIDIGTSDGVRKWITFSLTAEDCADMKREADYNIWFWTRNGTNNENTYESQMGTMTAITINRYVKFGGGSSNIISDYALDSTILSMNIIGQKLSAVWKTYAGGTLNTTLSNAEDLTSTNTVYNLYFYFQNDPRPAAPILSVTEPTTDANNNGVITIDDCRDANDKMEYRSSGNTAWTKVPVNAETGKTNKITGLAPGVYIVRRRATENTPAGKETEGVVQIHDHNFTYAASGNKIVATCDGIAGGHTTTLELNVKTSVTYTGKPYDGASIGVWPVSYNTLEEEPTTVSYVGRDGTTYAESTTAPTNAGKYTAMIKLSNVQVKSGDTKTTGDVIAKADFEITKATLSGLTATMSDYAYGGTVATPGFQGAGDADALTYYYNTSNSNTGGTEWKDITPTTLNVGTYYLYAVQAETTNCTSFTTPAVSFQVTKGDYTGVTKSASGNLFARSGSTVTITLPEIPHGTGYGTVTNSGDNFFTLGIITNGKITATSRGTEKTEAETFTVAVTPDGNHNGYTITVTVTPVFAAPCTVSFAMQGHGTQVSPITGVLYGSTITAPAAPNAGGYAFGGWYKDAGCKTAWNFGTDVVTRNTTLYAKWIADSVPCRSISGNVTEEGKTPPAVPNATVELFLGTVKVAATVTDSSGRYSFENVENGTYNIVVTKEDGKTKTKMVTISGSSATVDVELPSKSVNSLVEHTGQEVANAKSDISQTVVGGLDAIAAAQSPDDGEKITIKLKVEPKADTDTAEQKSIKKEAGEGKKVEFLDLSLLMQTNKSPTVVNIGGNNNMLLTIVIPFDFTNVNVTSVMILRNHGGKTTKLTSTPNDYGEYVEINVAAGTITLHAKKFSDYAIAYNEVTQGDDPGHHPGSHHGGDSTVRSTLTGDAGIALYGVLSVSALLAAGCCCAMLRKKRKQTKAK